MEDAGQLRVGVRGWAAAVMASWSGCGGCRQGPRPQDCLRTTGPRPCPPGPLGYQATVTGACDQAGDLPRGPSWSRRPSRALRWLYRDGAHTGGSRGLCLPGRPAAVPRGRSWRRKPKSLPNSESPVRAALCWRPRALAEGVTVTSASFHSPPRPSPPASGRSLLGWPHSPRPRVRSPLGVGPSPP